MADPTQQDFHALLEQLRSEHQDPRALLGSLLRRLNSTGTTDIRDAGPLAEEALRMSRELGDADAEAAAMVHLGFIRYLWQRNQEALALLLDAKPRIDATDDVLLKARCTAVLAGLYNTIGNFQKGLELGHEAIAMLDYAEVSDWHGWPLYILGDSFRASGDLDRARETYGRALVVFGEIGLETGIARALIGLGTVCRDQGDLEASENHFEAARALAENRDDPFTLSRTMSDLALVRQLRGDHDAALELFEESLRIRRERCGDLPSATCLIDLGKLALELGQPDEAVERLTEALELSVKHEHKPRAYAAHEGLAAAYTELGDLRNALHHQREFHRVKEEVMGADAATRLQNLEISLAAAAKEKEAELVFAHNEELRSKNTELARLLKELRDTQEMLIQSEKLASLGQLTAGIAHEIRNPLNFVNNFSVMTKDLAMELSAEITGHRDDPVHTIEPDVLELASEITANADRILEHGTRAEQIVSSMLAHSRRSGGKKSDVDVNHLISTSVDLAYAGFTATNGDLDLEIDRELSEDVGSFTVIEEEIVRVLTNIVKNALDALAAHARAVPPDGFEPRMRVTTARRDGKVFISIADNGPGIADADKKKVFEPFYTTKPAGSGTGLGLSQSYEIITERHGGSLSITDTDGGGATFVVALPVR